MTDSFDIDNFKFYFSDENIGIETDDSKSDEFIISCRDNNFISEKEYRESLRIYFKGGLSYFDRKSIDQINTIVEQLRFSYTDYIFNFVTRTHPKRQYTGTIPDKNDIIDYLTITKNSINSDYKKRYENEYGSNDRNIREGSIVKHKSFGIGKVIKLDRTYYYPPEAANLPNAFGQQQIQTVRAIINFDKNGEKPGYTKLLLTIAKLELLTL